MTRRGRARRSGRRTHRRFERQPCRATQRPDADRPGDRRLAGDGPDERAARQEARGPMARGNSGVILSQVVRGATARSPRRTISRAFRHPRRLSRRPKPVQGRAHRDRRDGLTANMAATSGDHRAAAARSADARHAHVLRRRSRRRGRGRPRRIHVQAHAPASTDPRPAPEHGRGPRRGAIHQELSAIALHDVRRPTEPTRRLGSRAGASATRCSRRRSGALKGARAHRRRAARSRWVSRHRRRHRVANMHEQSLGGDAPARGSGAPSRVRWCVALR